MKHELKIWSTFFEAALSGDKPFEIRDNRNREFQKGDSIVLNEIKKSALNEQTGECFKATGRKITGEITYVTTFEQKPDYVVFGYKGECAC